MSSIGGQFKRIGHTAAAFGLWGVIVWLILRPKRLLVFVLVVFTLFFSFLALIDDTGDKFYVNIKSLELVDKPFGEIVKTLELNDSLILIKKLSDDWIQVLVENDTLFFQKIFFYSNDFGYTEQIKKTPFTRWNALENQKVILNHPNGFLEIEDTMMKNGDSISVIKYLEEDNKIKFKTRNGRNATVSLEFLQIDWELILKDYPTLN
jgi:hypothetical protein